MKPKLFFLLLLLLTGMNVFAQTRMGVSTQFFQTTTTNIGEPIIQSYGHADEPAHSIPSLGASLTNIFNTKINNYFDVELGFGYYYETNNINIELSKLMGPTPQHNDLDIELHYLIIPAHVNFYPISNKKWRMSASLGLNQKILVAKKDNYNSIIYELILLDGNFYKNYVLDGYYALGVERKLSNDESIHIELFAAQNLTAFVKEGGWGFYERMYQARNISLGVHATYFFEL